MLLRVITQPVSDRGCKQILVTCFSNLYLDAMVLKTESIGVMYLCRIGLGNPQAVFVVIIPGLLKILQHTWKDSNGSL